MIYTNNKFNHSNNYIHDLHTQIRLLNDEWPHILPQHQNSYFFKLVHDYLETATQTQLELYLKHYQPVIMASMRRAENKTQWWPSLFNFAGFTHTKAFFFNCPLPFQGCCLIVLLILDTQDGNPPTLLQTDSKLILLLMTQPPLNPHVQQGHWTCHKITAFIQHRTFV